MSLDVLGSNDTLRRKDEYDQHHAGVECCTACRRRRNTPKTTRHSAL